MTILGTVKNGKVELEEGASLPDGTTVRIEPFKIEDDPAYGLAEEAVDFGVEDFAEQHDHYIYGTPKKPNR